MKRIKYPRRKKKIEYSTNKVFNIEFDYKNKIITLNDKIIKGDYVFILTDYSNFMRYKPPCKNCLVCNMCIIEKDQLNSAYIDKNYLYIKICEKLKHFISYNKLFYKEEI